MSQEITESVPRWIFIAVAGALWTVIFALQVWMLREQVDMGKLVVRFAVKADAVDRDMDKLEKRADLTQAKDIEQDSRILVLEKRQ